MEGEKNKSSVQQIKKEKRDVSVAPAPTGMSRRRFLTFLGTGSAALAAGSAGLLGCAEEDFTAATTASQTNGQTNGETWPSATDPSGGPQAFFNPIDPTAKDDLILAENFKYDIIRKWGDPVTSDRNYGYNNDYVAYFPIDAQEGGNNSEDGLLWINHEYVDSKWVSGYNSDDEERNADHIRQEKAAVGGSVVRVRKDGDTWSFVEGADANRRIDADTPIDLTGPAAGSEGVQEANEVVGTLANCGGGVTLWNTVLSCEENYQYYYGERTPTGPEDDEATADAGWLNAENPQPPEHYGWVVEIDPFDSSSKPRKHTWLGRVKHENSAMRTAEGEKVVVYTGHDQEDERIYKFVSSGTYNPGDRQANMDLLTDGMLYVADFGNGKWVPLDFENDPIFRDNGFIQSPIV